MTFVDISRRAHLSTFVSITGRNGLDFQTGQMIVSDL
jgi:hypothetical protein